MVRIFKILVLVAAFALTFETAAIPVLQARDFSTSGNVSMVANDGIESVSTDPIIALIASLLIPGLGQILLGKVTRGIMFLLAWFVSLALTAVIIGICLVPVVTIWAAYDAYVIAKGQQGGDDADDEEDDDAFLDTGITPIFLK